METNTQSTIANEVARQECESGFCSAPEMKPHFCASCDSFYCEACWERLGPHRPGKVGIDGLPHERTDIEIVNSLKAILEPPSSVDSVRKLHQKDAATKWFGVTRNEYLGSVTGHPHASVEFKDYGRYATLMAESRPSNGNARYPQLVSFIGQTNAGKSTIIKMLIAHGQRKAGVTSEFPSPVAGSIRNDKVPTSGDVHLYADPGTIHTQLPMLYADCEGLQGGEEVPLANEMQKDPANSGHLGEGRKLVIGGAKRVLEWAKDDITSGREYAVRNLYPRLLYTFSDVIVFVLKEPKTFESVALKLLLDWAASSLEKSLNQPILPHAVIVFNATDVQVHEDEWDVNKATQNLMAKLGNAIEKNPEFRSYVEFWRLRRKRLRGMEDLIKCYYSSISVIRIPAKGRYMKISEQIDKLHERITANCDEAFYKRERVRMLPNVDELNEYLEAGFKHFSKKLDVPFNFVEIAVRNHPVPQNFGDHVSNLAAAMRQDHEYNDPIVIFELLSGFVASCLLLDAVRGRRPGNLEEFFDKYYRNMCEGALDRFCDMFLPCSFTDYRGRKCQNMKSGHSSKGHQDIKGKIIGSESYGTYESSFTSASYKKKWTSLIKKHLVSCEKRLQERHYGAGTTQHKSLPEANEALQLHVEEQLKVFFAGSGGATTYYSLATCYCCLMNVPEHPLPCGHVLCTPCIKGYGIPLEHSKVRMDYCPLHPVESDRFEPWVIHFKPEFAGVRVLSLDGGGIRGIMELEILREIERSLGGKIPVQRFFDLIVGTSTGGIVALSIGAKHWSVRKSIEKFTSTCKQAFTPRELKSVKGINKMVTLRHGSKFKTTPLHQALSSAFGDEYLFGGEQESDTAYMTKVAVTTTSGTGQTPIVITNYGRQDERHQSYNIEFSLGADLGLKVWEAAAATSAAPSFFKAFKHPRADRTYMDGALYYNNPVKVANKERKLLWPDVADHHPDLLLSIGTGQKQLETQIHIQKGYKKQTDVEKRKNASNYGKLDTKETTSRRAKIFRTAGNVKNFFSVLVNRMDNILDSEIEWRDFYSDIGDAEIDTQRYIRINPDLGSKVPRLDETAEMLPLQNRTINFLESTAAQRMIQGVCHRLVASSFYFEKFGIKEVQSCEKYSCSGKLHCRFQNGSNELRELGRYLKNKQTEKFQPAFVVKDSQHPEVEQLKIIVTSEKVAAMIDRAVFDMEVLNFFVASRSSATTISLVLSESENTVPNFISGLPRTLVNEDQLRDERIERHKSTTKTTTKQPEPSSSKRPTTSSSTSAPATLTIARVTSQDKPSIEINRPILKQLLANKGDRFTGQEAKSSPPDKHNQPTLIDPVNNDIPLSKSRNRFSHLPFLPNAPPLTRPRSLPVVQVYGASEDGKSNDVADKGRNVISSGSDEEKNKDDIYELTNDDGGSQYTEVEEERLRGFEEYAAVDEKTDLREFRSRRAVHQESI